GQAGNPERHRRTRAADRFACPGPRRRPAGGRCPRRGRRSGDRDHLLDPRRGVRDCGRQTKLWRRGARGHGHVGDSRPGGRGRGGRRLILSQPRFRRRGGRIDASHQPARHGRCPHAHRGHDEGRTGERGRDEAVPGFSRKPLLSALPAGPVPRRSFHADRRGLCRQRGGLAGGGGHRGGRGRRTCLGRRHQLRRLRRDPREGAALSDGDPPGEGRCGTKGISM
ncbi:4-hydroxy-2-oxoglutarate aldolase @ 2-dehydro-3-deoxyphosphogluconate aldolase, partial [uncultured Rubrobacteraceae bacterium]